MKIDRVTKVVPVADERLLLDDSLRPIWMFLRWNGIVLNFGDEGKEKRAVDYFRFVLTLLILLVMMSYSLFEVYQLVFNISNIDDWTDIVIAGVLLIVGSMGLGCTYQFLSHGKEIRQFLKDWKSTERQSLEYYHGIKEKNIVKVLYMLYPFISINLILLTITWNIMLPEKIVFFTSVQSLTNVLNNQLLILLTTVYTYFGHIYSFVGEILPTLFFFHAGCAIEDLERELIQVSEVAYHRAAVKSSRIALISNRNVLLENGRPFHRIWAKYETICLWVSRANELFGTLMLFGYSAVFIYCSVSSYMAIKVYSTSPYLVLGFLALNIGGTLRAFLMNQMMSHLITSCHKLKTAIAHILSNKWNLIPEEDLLILVTFQKRLNEDQLNAAPFNLYSVNPSNLLNMLSLMVTYTIVLLEF